MKREEQEKERSKIIIVGSIAIVALLLIVGISYAFWQATKVQEDTNIISSGCFGVTLEGNKAINLANSYPMTLENGMKTTPYTFTITNTCSKEANYIVNLEALSNTNFESSSIRVALNETSKLYSEYGETDKYFNDSKEARTLASGTLANNESVTYDLRMWIDEKVTVDEQNKMFASKIVVTSGEVEYIEPSIENLSATSTIDTINITYLANGTTTCKYGLSVGTYDNEVSGVTTSNCTITGLSDNTTYYYQVCTETNKGSKCLEGNINTQTNTKPISVVNVGDYISMTPTSTSYTIPTSLTGYSSNQTISPSELNLWRVIRKNDDGTVEVVSENASSRGVLFYGKAGYMNYVGGLNTIAAQYTNSKYVSKTRHMGYSNQIEKCTAFNTTACPSDTGYETDISLVQKATGNLKNSELASRSYSASGDIYGIRMISSGTVGPANLYVGGSDKVETQVGAGIRPILTLKSDVQIKSGDGSSVATAYTFE